MKSVAQPESLGAETLDDAELAAARGGVLRADLIDLLRPVPLIPRLPVLTIPKPVLPRWPLPPPPPDPYQVFRPVLR